MKKQTVVVIHTGPVTVAPIQDRFRSLYDDIKLINIVDDSLLNEALEAGGITTGIRKRMFTYASIGEELGASIILNACSSVGEVVEDIQPLIGIPILRIDQPMALEAIELGRKIGVVATVPTTLHPTIKLIEEQARLQGKTVDIEPVLCEGAFAELLKGNSEAHDEIVVQSVRQLSHRVEVIVLAQVSMARLMAKLADFNVPVLTSPDSGVAAIGRELQR